MPTTRTYIKSYKGIVYCLSCDKEVVRMRVDRMSAKEAAINAWNNVLKIIEIKNAKQMTKTDRKFHNVFGDVA